MLRIGFAAVMLLSFTIAGCGGSTGPKPVPVKGKVMLKGKPVDGAEVTFLSTTAGRSASGRTNADGTFSLTTMKTGDGAPPGDYVVTISKIETKGKKGGPETDVAAGVYGPEYASQMAAAASGEMSKVFDNKLPEKYASPAESGLKRTVVQGDSNDFDFDLE